MVERNRPKIRQSENVTIKWKPDGPGDQVGKSEVDDDLFQDSSLFPRPVHFETVLLLVARALDAQLVYVCCLAAEGEGHVQK